MHEERAFEMRQGAFLFWGVEVVGSPKTLFGGERENANKKRKKSSEDHYCPYNDPINFKLTKKTVERMVSLLDPIRWLECSLNTAGFLRNVKTAAPKGARHIPSANVASRRPSVGVR